MFLESASNLQIIKLDNSTLPCAYFGIFCTILFDICGKKCGKTNTKVLQFPVNTYVICPNSSLSGRAEHPLSLQNRSEA